MPSSYWTRRLLAAARCGAIFLIILGAAVILGWVLHIEILKSILPGKITMKTNTAIGFLSCGLEILLLLRAPSRWARVASIALPVLTILIGGATLVEYIFHANLRIDELIFRDPVQWPYPGRIAHITAVNFCVAGAALLLLALTTRRTVVAQALSVLCGVSALLGITGYLYGVPLLYGSLRYTSMALHTGVGFLVLAVCIMFCRPESGIMSVPTSSLPGGWLLRLLLPFAVGTPVLFGAVFLAMKPLLGDMKLVLAATVITQVLLFGTLIWIVAFFLNRSADKEAKTKDALARSEEMLRQSQKMEALGMLAGGVAHDFNNLLGVIIGYSELLLTKMHEEDPHVRKVQYIKKAGESAASLTRQLLTFSRRQVIQPKLLDLNRTITEIDKMLRRLLREDIRLDLELTPHLDNILADQGQMEQILMNLVTNACDAMPYGGQITVTTTNVSPSRANVFPGDRAPQVLLTVKDTGIGMDEETRAHIFEPFFTTKPVGKGTGLGLATVYGIVEQSGGRLEVESAPGQGCSFHVYLPAVKRDGKVLEALVQPPLPGTETVLVVEDADTLREMIYEGLDAQGYTVLLAEDAESGALICEQYHGHLDLLITDVVMPGMNGYQLAQKVGRLRPEINVLFISGYVDDPRVRECLAHPGSSFLQKPFTAAELGNKAREIFEARERSRKQQARAAASHSQG